MAETPMRHRLMRIIDTMRDDHESGPIVDALLDEMAEPNEAMCELFTPLNFTAMVKAIRNGA